MFLGAVNMQNRLSLTTKIYCVAYYFCSVNQTESWHGIVGILEEELGTVQKLCNAICVTLGHKGLENKGAGE